MSLILRLELEGGEVKFRLFENEDWASDHATLCRAFGLDPIRTTFELPSTWRGTGSASGLTRRKGLKNGVVFWPAPGAMSERDRVPIGTITQVQEGERIPDIDPRNLRDFYDLNRKVG